MIVTCDKCSLTYDDLYRWTICPHEEFEMNTLAMKSTGESKVCTTIEELNEFLWPST